MAARQSITNNCSIRNVQIIGRASASLLALLAMMLVLELVLVPIALAQPTGIEKSQSNFNNNNNNNLDSIMSELIEDANQRLKKSKVGRHLKSSLRFGRRSDPLFAPNELDEMQDNALYQVPISLD